MGAAAALTVVVAAWPAGLAVSLVPALLMLAVGWLMFAGWLAQRPKSRVQGIALMVGPFLWPISVMRADPTGIGLTVKMAIGVAGALILGFGAAACTLMVLRADHDPAT